MTPDRFARDAQFAKYVETADGPAVLICGHVLHISGPDGVDWADVVSRGLRRMSRGELVAFQQAVGA